LWSWYYWKLIEEINFYSLRNYSRILVGLWTYNQDRLIMTFGLNDTDITCTTLHSSDITCTTLHVSGCTTICLSLDIAIGYIALWTWYTSYSLSNANVWYRFLILLYWIIHYHTFALINKINQAGVTGGTVAGEIQRGVLGRVTPLWVWMPHVILLFMRAHVITCYMIPEYSELFLPAIRIH